MKGIVWEETGLLVGCMAPKGPTHIKLKPTHGLVLLFAWLTRGEIIQFSGRLRYLSTIPLKNSHLFKIIKSVISFCLKKLYNSAILNM